MKIVQCDYCGRPAELVDSSLIYGRSYGHKVWLCRYCMAYVGCHKGTNKPLGRLANAELREWKKRAHDAFDPIWQVGRFRDDRKAAYAWMAKAMGKTKDTAHIGMFDVADCKRLIQIIKAQRKYLYGGRR